jgi:hypothetical protein
VSPQISRPILAYLFEVVVYNEVYKNVFDLEAVDGAARTGGGVVAEVQLRLIRRDELVQICLTGVLEPAVVAQPVEDVGVGGDGSIVLNSLHRYGDMGAPGQISIRYLREL